MSKDPAFLFYSSDFMMGTMVMSFEDRGKYITLLSYMHQNGRISLENMQALVGDVSDNLKLKFKIDENGLWYNERLEEAITKRERFNASRRSNGMLGGRPVAENAKPRMVAQKHADEIIPEIEPAVEKYPFDKFWTMYDKPTEKQSCETKWNKLAEQDREIILQRLPAYVKATPDTQYRKNPLTYLNRKIWLDDFIPEHFKKPKKSAFKQLAETGSYE